jgi:hypothetical protein
MFACRAALSWAVDAAYDGWEWARAVRSSLFCRIGARSAVVFDGSDSGSQ